ncbi:Cupin domain protein [Halogranum amylolyticum]|uniref:Cupin domain protein n=1 Tax=Halogranum amylolyticum TaxID=660520 RepID=A0A1H8STJ5_9EURY|nr:cupin domain-containing protein [Halogranum amylolyticum]SEO81865.1 Cupin domain protein [Halogranum amylolyticum]
MTGYRKVTVDDLPNTPNPTREKREVDEAVGAAAFGFNVFRADPGERLPWGYHSHPEQEELFYVVAGELAVETPEREYHVEAGEAFFVPPDHPNCARAVGDESIEVIAVGAPKDSDEATIAEECPVCGGVTDRTYETETDGDTTYVLRCARCGAETDRFD